MTRWPLLLLTAPPHPKVLDQDTDAIAVHVVRVLTCIMSGSPSAKVRMLQSGHHRGVGVGVKLTACPQNWSSVWLLERGSWGGDHLALWGAAQGQQLDLLGPSQTGEDTCGRSTFRGGPSPPQPSAAPCPR